MSKLHELIAVEADTQTTAKKVVEEATVTFSKKADHFIEKVVRLEMFDEKDKNQERTDAKAMVTTVFQKLDYVRKSVGKYYDLLLQKEKTNQNARADLVVDGVVLLKDVPGTFLLGMENRLKELRAMYEAIPTLQPGPFWMEDPTKDKGVYRSRDAEVRFKTEKKLQYQIITPATDKHPAQVEKWMADVPVGRYVEDVWSSMLSPTQKSELLGRIDNLIRACKKARQRANTTEVSEGEAGTVLFNYIHNGM